MSKCCICGKDAVGQVLTIIYRGFPIGYDLYCKEHFLKQIENIKLELDRNLVVR